MSHIEYSNIDLTISATSTNISFNDIEIVSDNNFTIKFTNVS
jgi:hypothetical protein